MKAFVLALTLINAPVEEQYEMLADMYDADPRLAYEVLDVADDIADSAAYGGETHFNVPREPFFDSVDDSTKKPDTSGWNYLKDDTVNVKDAYDVDHSGTLQWEGSIGGAKPNVPIAGPQTYDRSGNDTVKWIPGINAKSDTVSIDRLKQQYIITNCRAELDGIPNQMDLMKSFAVPRQLPF